MLLLVLAVHCSAKAPRANRRSDWDHDNPQLDHSAEGVRLANAGDLDGAIAAFRAARRFLPEVEDSVANLAVVLMQRGNGLEMARGKPYYAEAWQAFQDAKRMGYTDATNLQAIEDNCKIRYQRPCKELFGDTTAARPSRARPAELPRGRFEDGVYGDDSGDAVEEEEEEVDERLGRYSDPDADLDRGLEGDSEGDYDYREEREADPPRALLDADQLKSEAIRLASERKFDEALKFFREVQTLRPNDLNSYEDIGVCQMQAGNNLPTDQALPRYRDAYFSIGKAIKLGSTDRTNLDAVKRNCKIRYDKSCKTLFGAAKAPLEGGKYSSAPAGADRNSNLGQYSHTPAGDRSDARAGAARNSNLGRSSGAQAASRNGEGRAGAVVAKAPAREGGRRGYNPKDPSVDHHAAGLKFSEAGDLVGAMEAFEASTKFFPKEPSGYVNLALMNLRRGRQVADAEALPLYRTAYHTLALARALGGDDAGNGEALEDNCRLRYRKTCGALFEKSNPQRSQSSLREFDESEESEGTYGHLGEFDESEEPELAHAQMEFDESEEF